MAQYLARARYRDTALPGTALGDESGEGLVPHGQEVLVVLEHGSEGLLDRLDVELLLSERAERAGPVDRLGEPRGLGEVERAQPRDERRGLGGEALRHAGDAQPDDLDLALDGRVPDPVEEAAALERVVEL